jgi:hypothetical protein
MLQRFIKPPGLHFIGRYPVAVRVIVVSELIVEIAG